MKEHLNNFDCSRMGIDVNAMLDEFYNFIYNTFELFVPKATKNLRKQSEEFEKTKLGE